MSYEKQYGGKENFLKDDDDDDKSGKFYIKKSVKNK